MSTDEEKHWDLPIISPVIKHQKRKFECEPSVTKRSNNLLFEPLETDQEKLHFIKKFKNKINSWKNETNKFDCFIKQFNLIAEDILKSEIEDNKQASCNYCGNIKNGTNYGQKKDPSAIHCFWCMAPLQISD